MLGRGSSRNVTLPGEMPFMHVYTSPPWPYKNRVQGKVTQHMQGRDEGNT